MPPSFPTCPEPLLKKEAVSSLKSRRFPVPRWGVHLVPPRPLAPGACRLPSRPVELCAGSRVSSGSRPAARSPPAWPPRYGKTNTGLADVPPSAEPKPQGSPPDTGDRPGINAPRPGYRPLPRGTAAPPAAEAPVTARASATGRSGRFRYATRRRRREVCPFGAAVQAARVT